MSNYKKPPCSYDSFVCKVAMSTNHFFSFVCCHIWMFIHVQLVWLCCNFKANHYSSNIKNNCIFYAWCITIKRNKWIGFAQQEQQHQWWERPDFRMASAAHDINEKNKPKEIRGGIMKYEACIFNKINLNLVYFHLLIHE